VQQGCTSIDGEDLGKHVAQLDWARRARAVAPFFAPPRCAQLYSVRLEKGFTETRMTTSTFRPVALDSERLIGRAAPCVEVIRLRHPSSGTKQALATPAYDAEPLLLATGGGS
jgi:hypothetical protein